MLETQTAPHAPVQRWVGCLEYDGSAYHGWQTQTHASNIQDKLDSALSKVANTSIHADGSGRTDAGVHARGQIIHFDSPVERKQKSWLLGTNRYLPHDIALLWVKPAPPEFHARYSAIARSYQYWILDRSAPSALWHKRVFHSHYSLDAKRMHQAAQVLLGEQDFSAFRAAECQSRTPFRNVYFIRVKRQCDWICVEIKANAFLHHMVRNIVGSLWEIGHGKRSIQWLANVLATKNRTLAGITAPACGLYMHQVHYPKSIEAWFNAH